MVALDSFTQHCLPLPFIQGQTSIMVGWLTQLSLAPFLFSFTQEIIKCLYALIPPGHLLLRKQRLTHSSLSLTPHIQPANPVCSLQSITASRHHPGSSHHHLSPDYGNSLLSQAAWYMKDGHKFIVLLSTLLNLALASECFSQLHIEEAMLCQALRRLSASVSCLLEPSLHAVWKP